MENCLRLSSKCQGCLTCSSCGLLLPFPIYVSQLTTIIKYCLPCLPVAGSFLMSRTSERWRTHVHDVITKWFKHSFAFPSECSKVVIPHSFMPCSVCLSTIEIGDKRMWKHLNIRLKVWLFEGECSPLNILYAYISTLSQIYHAVRRLSRVFVREFLKYWTKHHLMLKIA